MTSEPYHSEDDPALGWALLSLRIGLAILFFIWALDKIIQPDHAKAVLQGFYGQNPEAIPAMLPLALGLGQLVLVLAFVAGAAKSLTYGLVLLMHLATTIVSLKLHLDPLGTPNILFWANWPILGAALALFILRRRDTKLSV